MGGRGSLGTATSRASRDVQPIELQGSEKQVAWANDIRAKGLDLLDSLVNREQREYEDSKKIRDRVKARGDDVKAYDFSVDEHKKRFESAKELKNNIINQMNKTTTSAKWYIDNRYNVKSFVSQAIDYEKRRLSKLKDLGNW